MFGLVMRRWHFADNKGSGMNPNEMVTREERRYLLELARNAIVSAVGAAGRPLPPLELSSTRLREKRGVFVTLWQEGALRGCIGFPIPIEPLADAVRDAAVSAALRDPRFPPVVPEEVQGLLLEISVLTRPGPIDPSDIRVGVHGLLVRQGARSGLLLPQVAIEYRWDVPTFLRQICIKAGLPEDAWEKGAELSGFEAQVFSEEDEEEKAPRR